MQSKGCDKKRDKDEDLQKYMWDLLAKMRIVITDINGKELYFYNPQNFSMEVYLAKKFDEKTMKMIEDYNRIATCDFPSDIDKELSSIYDRFLQEST